MLARTCSDWLACTTTVRPRPAGRTLLLNARCCMRACILPLLLLKKKAAAAARREAASKMEDGLLLFPLCCGSRDDASSFGC